MTTLVRAKCCCLGVLCMAWSLSAMQAAPPKRVSIGFRLGAETSQIKSLDKVLVAEGYYGNYAFAHDQRYWPAGSVFIDYPLPRTPLSVEFSIAYYRLSTRLHYTDINHLRYTVTLDNNNLGPSFYLKVHPWLRFYVGAGVRLGLNLTPESLRYSSNQEDERFADYQYETVRETEASLRSKIKGRTDVGVGGLLGYEFPMGLLVHLAYHYSVLDLVETLPNNYRWAEVPNFSHNIQLTVGWAFRLNRKR